MVIDSLIQNEDVLNTTEIISNRDWKVVNITEVLSKNNGIKIGPFGSQLKRELLTTTGYKVYGQENVYKNDFEIGTRYISKEHFQKLKSCELNDGDFIISMMGTIGKCSVIPKNIEPGIMDSHLIRLRLDSNKIDSNLLFHFFSSNNITKQIKKLSVGGIMEGLSSKIIKQLMIPFPPTKAEQTGIATALSDVDALINSLEKLIAKKKAIKQGAMQELLRPKNGWYTKILAELVEFSNGIAHEKYIDKNGDYIIINSKFVSSESNIAKYTNKNLFPLKKNDIVIVMSDIPNGKALAKCLLIDTDNRYTLNQRIGLIRPKSGDSIFYFYQLNRNKYFLSFDSGTGQTNLRKVDILNCSLLLPPTIEDQTIIALILLNMDTEIKVTHLYQYMA